MLPALWKVLFFNLLSGVAMSPLPSTSSPPVSIYDICSQIDLNQIEELKESLFQDLNTSSADWRNNKSSVSFGLLDEDWKRLLVLESRIPEGSILKSKMLLVFRILIDAVKQAHGPTLAQDEYRYDSNERDEEQHSFDFDENYSSNEVEVGESRNYNVYDSNYNSRATTQKSFITNDILSSSSSFDVYDDEHLRFDDSNVSPSLFTILPTYLTQFERSETLKPSFNEEQPTEIEDSNNGDEDKIIIYTKSFKMFDSSHALTSTSSLPLLHTRSQGTDGSMTETFVAVNAEPVNDKVTAKVNDITNSAVTVREYVEDETTFKTTETSDLQKLNGETRTSPTVHLKYSTINSKLTDDTSSFNREDSFDTTKSLEQTTPTPVYPELVELILENGRMDTQKFRTIYNNDFEKDLRGLASTTKEPWGNNQIIEDLDGSDSFIDEVIVPENISKNEEKDITESDEDEESQESGEGIYGLTNDQREYDWHLNKPSSNESSKYDYITQELPIKKTYDTYNSDETVATSLFEMETSDNNNDKETNNDKLNHQFFGQSTTWYLQPHESSSTDEHTSNGAIHTQPITTTSLNVEDNDEINEITHTTTVKDLGANGLPTNNDLYDLRSNKTSPINKKGLLVLTDAEVSLPRFVGVSVPDFENSEDVEENVVNPLTISGIEDDAQGSSEERNKSTSSAVQHNLEHLSSAESYHFQNGTEGKGVLGSMTNVGGKPATDIVSEKPKQLSSAISDKMQDISVANNVLDKAKNPNNVKGFPGNFIPESYEITGNDLSSTNKSEAESHVERLLSQSSEHGSSEENAHYQNNSVERNIFYSTEDGKTIQDGQLIPDSSEHVQSSKKSNVQSSTEETDVSSSATDDAMSPGLQFNFSEIQLIPSVKEHSYVSNSIERNEFSPKDDYEVSQAVGSLHESSENTNREENESVERGVEEKEIESSRKIDDDVTDLLTENLSPESSKQMFSAEDVNSQSTSSEKTLLGPKTINDDTIGLESSEHILSAGNGNIQTSDEVTANKVNETMLTPNPDSYQTYGKNSLDIKDFETEGNDDKSVFDQEIVEPPTKEDQTNEDKEPPMAFHSGESTPLNKPLLPQTYNELRIYPTHQYPFTLSNFSPTVGCQSGNDCVHVKHIVYTSSDNPFSPRMMGKRAYSMFKSKAREIPEVETNMSKYFVSEESENLY